MAINYTTQYSPKVSERFKKKSYTSSAASSEYTFDGVKGILVYSVDTVPIGNYTRNGSARYGTPSDLTDTVQAMDMTQDKAFTYVIDKGDNKEQINIKSANRALSRQMNERVLPMLDKYNLDVWCRGAGSHITDGGNAVNKNTITETIMDCTEALDEADAPETGRTLFVTNAGYKLLKLNPHFLENDKLSENALVRGQVGMIDNMVVKKVPNSYLPTGVLWVITHKSAILAPLKLKDYKIHQDPPGINGDLTEGRIMHDAFVLEQKSKAVCVMLNSNYAIAAPVLTNDATNSKVTLKSNTTGVDIWYTTDGSDPYFSAKVHKLDSNNASVNFSTLNSSEAGYAGSKLIKAVAVPNSNTALFRSDIVELQYA